MLDRIRCPPRVLRMIKSFHEDMTGNIQYNGSTAEAFDPRRRNVAAHVAEELKMVTYATLPMEERRKKEKKEAFDIRRGVKQGCVLAPTLFRIFFAFLLKHAFGSSTEGIYLHTRSDGLLCNLVRLKAKTKVREVLIWDMLFADAAAVSSHT